MSWRNLAVSVCSVLALANARADTVTTHYEGYAGTYVQVQARQANGTWIAGGSTSGGTGFTPGHTRS